MYLLKGPSGLLELSHGQSSAGLQEENAMSRQVPTNREGFLTQAEAIESLSQNLSARYPQSNCEWAIITGQVSLIEKITVRAEKPRGEAAPALMRSFRYVIRNEDLQLFNAVLDGMVAAVPASFFILPGVDPQTHWAAVAAIVAGLLKVGRQAATKGVVLDKQHYAVLTTLRDMGELTFDELLDRLKEQESDWDDEKLRAALSLLQNAPSLDNSEIKLVISLPGQRWRTSGI
jgi:hypothetical protein